MRKSLKELYGLQGTLFDQYVVFWKRILVADFGPSLSAFPTPVSTLIWRALPWTVGLLVVATSCPGFSGMSSAALPATIATTAS